MTVDLANVFAAKEKKRDETRLKKQAERREKWRTIQKQAPDIAAFISDFNTVFGRASYTQVEIASRVVVDTFPKRFQDSGFVPEFLGEAKTGELTCYWNHEADKI